MFHSFDIRIAKEVGVNAAIIFQNIFFWVQKNAANEENCHGGRYWTYNSREAFTKLFPYMSEKKIATALQILEEKGVIDTGRFNKLGFDRTLWYTVNMSNPLISDILQNGVFQDPKMSNARPENVPPIPDKINTDINQDKNIPPSPPKRGRNDYTPEFLEFWEMYPPHNGAKSEAFKAYNQSRKENEHETIIRGATEYAGYCKRNGTPKQYIAHASTWLNQSRWSVDYGTEIAGSSKPNGYSGKRDEFADTVRAAYSRLDADQPQN